MAKNKPDTKKEQEVQETTEQIECVEVTPEQLELLTDNGMQTVMNIGLAERLYLEDLADRIFYCDTNITNDLLHSITMQIYKINGMDKGIDTYDRQPIVIILNSFGGDVFEGISLMDAISQSKTPVIGICVGHCASMAFGIYSVCHVRIAMPNSVFMYHDGSEAVYNTATKADDWFKFSPKLTNRIDKMIASHSKFTVEMLQNIAPHDNWWFADEMQEKGIVDHIIGKDIEIEDIFGFMSDNVEFTDEVL